MRLTYIRWSMTLVESLGVTLITDPVFHMYGLPQAPRSYTRQRMPRPDLVFLSHTHVDHFDPATLRRLPPATPVWMPSDKVGRAAGLHLDGLRGVEEWESDTFRDLKLTVVPALHSGGELGLVVEGDRTVYFAGDTSLDRELFREIASRWRLDAVLLPAGDLRLLGVPSGHMGPKKAARALRLLGEPHLVVPTHYSGMSLAPLMYFAGSPRKLGQALTKAEVGSIVATTRPLESVEL